MASTGIDTGHGGSIAFSAGIAAWVAPFRKIGAVETAIEKVEKSTLANTLAKSYLPGDTAEPGEFECEYGFDATLAQPVLLTSGTITITAPIGTGQNTPAILAGSGFIMSRTATPEFTTNGLQVGKLKIKFTGVVGPNLTIAVDT